MKHCHGSPADFIQADCGDVGPHDAHDFTEDQKVCLGAPAGVEADCGRAGPHARHPMSETPEAAR